MQDDITDTVNHFIKSGVADANRVCIYGASYGGYATMAGLTFTPDLYKCGVNVVGVTDVGLLFTSMPTTWEPMRDVMKIQIGDPEDTKLIKSGALIFSTWSIGDILFINLVSSGSPI